MTPYPSTTWTCALLLTALSPFLVTAEPPPASRYAEILVLDADTGEGVPLVELTTVNQLRFVTDNAGRVAFDEPGLMGKEIFFSIRSHGYEVPKDGFGIAGVKVTPKLHEKAVVKIQRRNIAERLCRLTGEGRYRDSRLLGYQPLDDPAANSGLVAGQDSVQSARYRDQIFWFWGDTQRMSYPLGMFRTSGATTPIPDTKMNLRHGLGYKYFVDTGGFSRPMMPYQAQPDGVIWIDGVCVVPDEKGVEKLIAHYSRRKGLDKQLEQGIAIFDDRKAVFEPTLELPLTESWRFPRGHPIVFEEAGKKWLLSGNPAIDVRVPANLKDVLNPKQYEAFTCKTGDGKPVWEWQTELPPTDSSAEAQLVKAGKLKPEQTRYHPAHAADDKERIRLHSGTVQWNAYRKKWILVAGQAGGKSSELGEVWYAEANHPMGPFDRAVKVVTHDRQSFYNVCHHPFLDREGGRIIHFEGTYTSDFSGNPDKTPRYEYNQILYSLDLEAPALIALRKK